MNLSASLKVFGTKNTKLTHAKAPLVLPRTKL